MKEYTVKVKFDEGDWVWMMKDGDPVEVKIVGIGFRIGYWEGLKYWVKNKKFEDAAVPESFLHATREECITQYLQREADRLKKKYYDISVLPLDQEPMTVEFEKKFKGEQKNED